MFKIILICLFLSLGACAAKPISYKPVKNSSEGQQFQVGYSDVQISKGRHHVKFQGNGINTTADVYQKFLRRAAEVTKANGGKYFKVENGIAGKGGWAQVPWPNYEGDVIIKKKMRDGYFKVSEIVSKYVKKKRSTASK